MVLINRALRVRIYPTQDQRTLINKTLGSCRFIYNQMLAERIKTYEELKDDRRALYDHKYKSVKEYKIDFPWLSEVSARSLQMSNNDLNSAYQNFFDSIKKIRKGERVGFPKFKKKRLSSSFHQSQTVRVNFENSTLTMEKIPKIIFRHKHIKEWYKTATVRSMTVSRTSSGKYFVSVLFEGEQDFKGYSEIKKDPKIIGLDMSLDKFYVDQLGNSPEWKRFYRVNQEKLAKAQHSLSRKTKGSKNREKAKIRVARVHERISNQRKYFVDKLSTELAKNYDVIVVESLSLKGMSMALNLGKSVMDLGYSSFIFKLKYKCLWNDKTLIQADKWFTSSKTCSFCGYIKKDLMLQERSWSCPSCKTTLNRDQNAGRNLVNYGLEKIGSTWSEFTSVESKTSGKDESLLKSLDVEAENLSCKAKEVRTTCSD